MSAKRYFRTHFGLHSFTEAYSWIADNPPQYEKLQALFRVAFGRRDARPGDTERYFRTKQGLISYETVRDWLVQEPMPKEPLLGLLLVVFGETGSVPPGEFPKPPRGLQER